MSSIQDSAAVHAPRAFKTLHLTNAFHPSSGGVRAVFARLIDGANRLERPVRLVVPGERSGVEDVGPYGRIYYVKAPRAFAVDRRYRLIMPWSYLLPWVHGIQDILRDEQPDIVEVCDKHSLIYVAGLLRRGWIPSVVRPTLIAHSAERFDDNVETYLSRTRITMWFAAWFMRAIYTPMFDYHLANSEYTAGELRLALEPHRQDVVKVTPPALAQRHSAAERARRPLTTVAGGTSARVLLYVGRLSREKNLDLLFATLARLNDGHAAYRLILAGDGPERERLERLATGFGERVTFLGNLPGADAVAEAFAGADVLVHPNPREPFGLAPLEAMAAGLPVVVPNSGGVLTYADNATAWLAEPTAAGFATVIRELFADPARAQARAAAGVIRACAFREDVAIPRYFDLLDTLHRERLGRHETSAPREDECVRTAASVSMHVSECPES